MKTTLTVPGKPIPQGSLRAMPYMAGGKPRAVIVQDKQPLLVYRADIQSEWDGIMPFPPILTGPVILHCVFVFARPAAHYLPANSKRAKRELRPTAPIHLTGTPDLDKLFRSVGDALSGRAYEDDRQVVQMHGEKVYGEYARTIIDVLDVSEVE